LKNVIDFFQASYPPYLFELFPAEKVNELESSCIKSEDELIFTLVKENGGNWEKLEKQLTKEEMKEHRESILKDIATKHGLLAKEKSGKYSPNMEFKKRNYWIGY
jgi:hypothetical protein